MGNEFLKDPLEWSKGQSGVFYLENKDLADTLVRKGYGVKIIGKEEVTLLNDPEPATYLFKPKNTRVYYKLKTDDLHTVYRVLWWLHGHYHNF